VTLQVLNQAETEQAAQLLQQCCTSDSWIARVLEQRPFADADALRSAADTAWQHLDEADYLQAFEGHPKIGDVNSLKAKYADTKQLAAGEQASVNSANETVISALAAGNAAYEKKFGFIFIVCATGKSAGEMLALLQERLRNSREQELANAAEEQRKIFHLRLEKLL
jgi:2-oxo-4-hydroxy-4-carboxy-5-ureidoimidazoline decarboxylase